ITEIAGDKLIVAVIDGILLSVTGSCYDCADLALHIDEAGCHPGISDCELREEREGNTKDGDRSANRICSELGAAVLAVEGVVVYVAGVAGGNVQSLEGRKPFGGDRRQVHGATGIDEHEAQCASTVSPARNVLDAIDIWCAEVSASNDEVAGSCADWSGLADS